ncbi:MAG: acyl-CoA dehydrogenase family protein [Ichthyobacteriaceae bacterium]|nr:acyl-CoA dehydrogenase family protein [Ichthyobacteriaceae bacterium]
MNFEKSEEQLMIADSIKEFAKQYILPFQREWDEKQIFPIKLLRQLGEMGFMGVLVPEEYGGSGFGYNEYITVVDELSKADPSIGLSVAAHNSLCTNHILEFGTEEQKHKWLPKLATGEWIGAWGLTETSTGSDAGNMNCTAKLDGDEWVINGTKNFITHGENGDVVVLMTRTGAKGDKRGATAIVVEKGVAGFTSGKKEDKLGMRASETTELIFDNVRVPKENALGEVGDGFVQALKILDGGRISIAAVSLGIAKGSLEASLKYSKEREQFGKPISAFQGISFKLAEMATEIDASELLTYKAAWEKESGLNCTKTCAMAKYMASEACVRISSEAVQIHGGYGYTKDFPVERYFRDSKLCTIGEGTTEIQKFVISRLMLKE